MDTPTWPYPVSEPANGRPRIQRSSVTLPNAKVVNLGYGASASIADDLTRVNTLPLSSVKLANYTYTGMTQLASTRLPATGLGRSVYLKRVTPDHWIRFD